jgi:hypothetical protein
MDGQQFYRGHLSDELDANGDLTPPWEKFPTYERYTIGWRMGDGEGWLSYWYVFLENLDPAFETRLAYLQRHPPAPKNWADRVYGVLYPSAEDAEGAENEDQIIDQRRAELLYLGLIASDASFPIWLSQQEGVRWPWEFSTDPDESPEHVARYWTRDLWFWSRQVAALRSQSGWTPPEGPESWQACAGALATGQLPAFDLTHGLLSLAQMLAAGRVLAPWQVKLTPADFVDSFEMDMGYVAAFRLWIMSAFDDREHFRRYLDGTKPPESWDEWLAENVHIEW